MPVNFLSDVDVVAISLVNKGANRKRIYLKKQDEEETFNLPAPHRLLKSEWSVFYSVVAEPGWRENAGVGTPGETLEDQWANEDEIRKAAHKFMQNGALVNRMHESLEPYGKVVENFIAQTDFEVDGETIKKGSWVVGIMPSEEGKEAIDKGEFSGISIQGSGIRTLDLYKKENGSNEEDATMANEDMTETPEQTILQKFATFLKGEVEEKETKNVAEDTKSTSDERIEKAAEALEKSTRAIESLANNLGTVAQKLVDTKTKSNEEEVEEDTGEELKKKLDSLGEGLEDLRDDIEKLAAGTSTQPEKDKVEKSDNPLAGLMFG